MRKLIIIAMGMQALLSYAFSGYEFSFILHRIVNREPAMIGESGTDNLVHFSYIRNGGGGHGMLAAGTEYDGINQRIPIGPKVMSIFLSVAKGRYQVFQDDKHSKHVTIQEFKKGSYDTEASHKIKINDLPSSPKGVYRLILTVKHVPSWMGVRSNAEKFSFKLAQAAVSKRSSSASTTSIVIHTPPQQQTSHSGSFDSSSHYGLPPTYAAPLLSQQHQQQQLYTVLNTTPTAPQGK